MKTSYENQRFSVPIVLIIFNRPDLTRRVFDTLRNIKPSQLFVIADGPRHDEDVELCALARHVVDSVDWDCQVVKHYAEENLGAGKRIASGLERVFCQVEEAIILEDDCVPSTSFFAFCRELLLYYRNDVRVMHIGGANLFSLPWLQSPPDDYEYSYFFVRIPTCWGWATWRRAWQHFDFHVRSWPKYYHSGYLECALGSNTFREEWKKNINEVYGGKRDIWDYQWVYACLSQGGFAIVPKNNLVSNYGFRADATHTTWENSPAACIEAQEIETISHPPFVAANLDYRPNKGRVHENKRLNIVKKIYRFLKRLLI